MEMPGNTQRDAEVGQPGGMAPLPEHVQNHVPCAAARFPAHARGSPRVSACCLMAARASWPQAQVLYRPAAKSSRTQRNLARRGSLHVVGVSSSDTPPASWGRHLTDDWGGLRLASSTSNGRLPLCSYRDRSDLVGSRRFCCARNGQLGRLRPPTLRALQPAPFYWAVWLPSASTAPMVIMPPELGGFGCPFSVAGNTPDARLRIPMMSAGHSELMSATCSDSSRPAVPIDVGRGGGSPAGRW